MVDRSSISLAASAAGLTGPAAMMRLASTSICGWVSPTVPPPCGGQPRSPGRAFTAQNWTATPRWWSIWLAGGGVTEKRTPKSLNVKSSV